MRGFSLSVFVSRKNRFPAYLSIQVLFGLSMALTAAKNGRKHIENRVAGDVF